MLFRCRSVGVIASRLLALWLMALVPAQVHAQSDLVVWVVPTEAEFFRDERADPTPTDVESFFRDPQRFFATWYSQDADFQPLSPRISIVDTSSQVEENPELARQVLGQRLILRSITSFINNTSFAGRVRVRFFGWTGLLGVLGNAGAAADRPHVIIAPSTWVAYLAGAGGLQPLDLPDESYQREVIATARVEQADPIVRAFGLCGNRLGRGLLALSDQCQDSRLYALPWLPDLRFLYFWKQDFGDATFSSRGSFEKALTAAHRARGDIPPFAFATAADWNLLHDWNLLLAGHGGAWGGARDFLPQRQSEDVIAYLDRLHRADLAAFVDIRRVELERRFINHRVGSVVAGLWMMRRLGEALGPAWPERIGVVLPPFNTEGIDPTTYLGGVHLGLTALGTRSLEAAELATYLTKDALREIAKARTDVWTRVPFALADQQAFGSVSAGLPPEVEQVIRAGLKAGQYPPRIPEWATTVEDQSTRLELFFIFKLIGEGLPELASRQVESLRARLDTSIYGAVRGRLLTWTVLWVGSPLIVGAFLWATVAWNRARQGRQEVDRLTAELELVMGQKDAVADRLAGEFRDPDDTVDPVQIAGPLAEIEDLLSRQARIEEDLEQLDSKKPIPNPLAPQDTNPPRRLDPPLWRRIDAILDSAHEAHATAVRDLPPGDEVCSDSRPGSMSPDDDPSVPFGTAEGLFAEFSGADNPMRLVVQQVRDVAPKINTSVLLTGESGVGKTLIGQEIHRLSGRPVNRFAHINCAAIPSELLESELFGWERGAFANAFAAKPGRLETANGGTVFLDEIGAMEPKLQAKLLLFLDNKKVQRLGGNREVALDVRILSATSTDLMQAVREGTFIEALYYRLHVVEIRIPALRERGQEEVLRLAEHFVAHFCERQGKKPLELSDGARRKLIRYQWKGNIRELMNVIERAVVFEKTDAILATTIEFRPEGESAESGLAPEIPIPQSSLPSLLVLADFEAYVKGLTIIAKHTYSIFPALDDRTSVTMNSREDVERLVSEIKRSLAQELGTTFKNKKQCGALLERIAEEKPARNEVLFYDLWNMAITALGRDSGYIRAPRASRRTVGAIRSALFRSAVWRGPKAPIHYRGITIRTVADGLYSLYDHKIEARERAPDALIPALDEDWRLRSNRMGIDEWLTSRVEQIAIVSKVAKIILDALRAGSAEGARRSLVLDLGSIIGDTKTQGGRPAWRTKRLLRVASAHDNDFNTQFLSVWVVQLAAKLEYVHHDDWCDEFFRLFLWDLPTMKAFGMLPCGQYRLWNVVERATASPQI